MTPGAGKRPEITLHPRLIILSLGFGVLFWVIESALHVFVFKDDSFFHQIYSPHPHEIWMRLVVIVLFIVFGIYGQWMLSARKRAEESATLANIELTQIFETSADGMRVVADDFTVLRANETFLHLSGSVQEDVLGKKCYDVFYGPLCRTDDCPLIRIRKGGLRVEIESEKVRTDGVKVSCIVTATPFKDAAGRFIGIVEDFKDISDRKQSEEKLRESGQQLRELASHLEDIREEERSQIVRELHDELGQALTALKMDVHWIVRNLSEKHEKINEKADGMSKLIDNTIHFIRRLSSELRPSLLDDFGLLSAIEWQVKEFKKRSDIHCTVDSNLEGVVLDQRVSIAVFRIFQEALTNIARHAGASRADIRIMQKGKFLELEVQDNGKGMDTRRISGPHAFGLIGIRERAASLGGSMRIESEEGCGTMVRVTIPVESEEILDDKAGYC